MAYRFGTRAELIATAERVVNGIRGNELARTRLARRKWDDARLAHILELRETVLRESRAYDEERREETEASAAYKRVREQVGEQYGDHVVLMRVGLKRYPALMEQLALNGPRASATSKLLEQMSQTYDGAARDDGTLALLDGCGVTADDLRAGREGMQELKRHHEAYYRERREAFDARERRDEAADALSDMLGDLVDVCRVELKDQPQLLRELGIA